MKYYQQIVLTATLLIVATTCGLAHIIDTETGLNFQYNAKEAEVAPVIDGFLNDPVWKDAETGKMEREVLKQKHWPASSDFTGEFASVWRNGFLYIAVKLTDDSIETHQAKLSRQDHLVIYLDMDHGGHKSDLYRYILPVGKNAPMPNSPMKFVAWSNDGQSCEMSFNLRQLPKKGDKVGFGIYYNDVDGGQLNHKVAWGPAGYADEIQFLPDLVFTAEIELNPNQKVIQWGRIKELY